MGMIGFLLAWFLLFAWFRAEKREKYGAFVSATTLWLTALFGITEGLSLLHRLTGPAVAVCWAAVCVLALIALVLRCRKRGVHPLSPAAFRVKARGETLRKDPLTLALFGLVTVILARGTWLAVHTVPYNWDSMTYHLPRILFWAEHQSVSYYGTNIPRQLISPVLAEYVNLHVYLLTGTDRWFNLLQNLSLYGCAFLAYGIARKIGAGRGWAALGSFLLVTMNIAYAESTTTQVDLFAALVLLVFVYQVVDLCFAPRIALKGDTLFRMILVGLSAGLLYIAKGNAAISAAALALVFVILRLISRDRILHLLALGLATCLTAGVVVAPTFVRNLRQTGDILASDYMGEISVSTTDPRLLAMVAVKNFTSVAVGQNDAEDLTQGVSQIGEWLQVDPEDYDISYHGTEFQLVHSTTIDGAGASVASWLIAGGLVLSLIILIARRKRADGIAFILLLQCLISMMCVKWQLWVPRLLLPALCMAIPGVCAVFSVLFAGNPESAARMRTERNLVGSLLMAAILMQGVYCHFDEYSMLSNYARLPYETEQESWNAYFGSHIDIIEVYQEFCAEIEEKGYTRIGLYTDEDSYQYPLMIRYMPEKQIENVVLHKEGDQRNPDMNVSFRPEVILLINQWRDPESEMRCNGNTYVFVRELADDYSIWALKPEDEAQTNADEEGEIGS